MTLPSSTGVPFPPVAPTTTTTTTHVYGSTLQTFLIGLVLVQWALLAYLLAPQEVKSSSTQTTSSPFLQALQSSVSLATTTSNECGDCCNSEVGSLRQVNSNVQQATAEPHIVDSPSATEWEGVAVVLLLRRPKWFFKRYNVMIHNAMANTPSNWAIQFLMNPEWVDQELLPYHLGLQRLFHRESHNSNPQQDGSARRLHFTNLPPTLANKKPNHVLRDPWVWEHMLADRVLLFHGDGAFCANSWKRWEDFLMYDYVGIPWDAFEGVGGTGTDFSLRRRSVMLEVWNKAGGSVNHRSTGAEDRHVVSTLLQWNKDAGYEKYKLATREVTNWFGGTKRSFDNGTIRPEHEWGPMIVHGTQPQLSDDDRNSILGKCPESKVIFPSLHNPNCFGARPNAKECAASLGFDPPCANATSG